MNEKLLKKSF